MAPGAARLTPWDHATIIPLHDDGAAGVPTVDKRTPPERLVQSIREVVAGGSMLSPTVTTRVIERVTHRHPAPAAPAWLGQLTVRERDVLRAMARGLANGEIAAELFIGENTVKTHVCRVFAKLGARDRAEAVIMAFHGGLVG